MGAEPKMDGAGSLMNKPQYGSSRQGYGGGNGAQKDVTYFTEEARDLGNRDCRAHLG